MTAGLRLALNGWFASSSVGSGQATDALVAALRAAYPTDDVRVIAPGGAERPRGGLSKVMFEQRTFPRAAAGADLAHVPYWAPPLRCAVPVVTTVHDLIPLALPNYRSGLRVRAYVKLVARATRRAAAIVADSAFTAQELRTRLGIPPDRLTVVPLGVDPRFAAAPRTPLPGLPERFGLYVGGFDPRKNLDNLFRAWTDVFTATDVPLVVAGAGDGVPESAAARTGLTAPAVRFLGHVAEAEKPALYAAATIFVYPSTYEGFGLPPLEAMAAGTPVVASAATSIPEVVGDAGLLVKGSDPETWVRTLVPLLFDEELQADLGRRGRERAAGFTWERTARATHAVYERVVGGATRP